jgi:hypothetical protein
MSSPASAVRHIEFPSSDMHVPTPAHVNQDTKNPIFLILDNSVAGSAGTQAPPPSPSPLCRVCNPIILSSVNGGQYYRAIVDPQPRRPTQTEASMGINAWYACTKLRMVRKMLLCIKPLRWRPMPTNKNNNNQLIACSPILNLGSWKPMASSI